MPAWFLSSLLLVALSGCARPSAPLDGWTSTAETVPDSSDAAAIRELVDLLIAEKRSSDLASFLRRTRGAPAGRDGQFGRNVPGGSEPGDADRAARLGYVVGAVSSALRERSGPAARLFGRDAATVAALLGEVAPERAVTVRAGVADRVAIDGAPVSFDEALRLFEEAAFPLDADGDPYGNEVLESYENARFRAQQEVQGGR